MDSVHTIFLILHIITGSIGLLSGTINLVMRKSGLLHRRIGLVFTISMLLAGVFALVLTFLNPNSFLLAVGIFTIYQVGTGYRYSQMRGLASPPKPITMDWILGAGMVTAAIYFLVSGGLLSFQGSAFGIVYLVFGAISILFVRADIKNFRGRGADINFWQTAHLQRMTGAYIAAATAFLVVNGRLFPDFIPNWLGWLLPTLVLTPLIVYWSRKYGISGKRV